MVAIDRMAPRLARIRGRGMALAVLRFKKANSWAINFRPFSAALIRNRTYHKAG